MIAISDGQGQLIVNGVAYDLRTINSIEAYKKDNLGYDTVFMEFHLDNETLVTSEAYDGFWDAVDLLAERYGFEADWKRQLLSPPFQENRSVLYTKPQ